MNLKKIASIYSIIIGVLIVGMWTAFLATGEVPELESAPLEIYYHITAELITAVLLFISGWALIIDKRWAAPLNIVALSMLLYSVINSAGYFAQEGVLIFPIMFGILTIITIVLLIAHLRE